MGSGPDSGLHDSSRRRERIARSLWLSWPWFVTHPPGLLPTPWVTNPTWFVTHCHLTILQSYQNHKFQPHRAILTSYHLTKMKRDSYHLTILPSHETRKGPVPSYNLTIRRTGGRISRPGLRALSSDMLTVHISLRSVT